MWHATVQFWLLDWEYLNWWNISPKSTFLWPSSPFIQVSDSRWLGQPHPMDLSLIKTKITPKCQIVKKKPQKCHNLLDFCLKKSVLVILTKKRIFTIFGNFEHFDQIPFLTHFYHLRFLYFFTILTIFELFDYFKHWVFWPFWAILNDFDHFDLITF